MGMSQYLNPRGPQILGFMSFFGINHLMGYPFWTCTQIVLLCWRKKQCCWGEHIYIYIHIYNMFLGRWSQLTSDRWVEATNLSDDRWRVMGKHKEDQRWDSFRLIVWVCLQSIYIYIKYIIHVVRLFHTWMIWIKMTHLISGRLKSPTRFPLRFQAIASTSGYNMVHGKCTYTKMWGLHRFTTSL